MLAGASVSILDYGADPFGVLDSTLAIQDAIDSGVKGVYVPAGIYLVSGQINVSEGTFMYGEGQKSIFNYTGSGICLYVAATDITIKDMFVTTPHEQGLISGGQIGIQLNPYTTYCTLNGVNVSNFYAAGIYMIDEPQPATGVPGPFHVVMDNCRISSCHLTGLHLNGRSNLNNVYIVNSGFENNGDNDNVNILIEGDRALNVVIQNCIVEGGLTTQIQIKGGSQIKLENLYFENSASGRPQIHFSGTGTCTGVSIKGCNIGVYGVVAPIIIDDGFSINGLVAKGNIWTSHGYSFIGTANGVPALVSDIDISENFKLEDGIAQSLPQINAVQSYAYTLPTTPTATLAGWYQIGGLNAKTTPTQLAHLIHSLGANSAFGNSIAWYKWDNPAYYVGISYDEINDRLALNTSSSTTGFYLRRTSGRIGLGNISGMPIYANNGAAISGGLISGEFYRTGGDPDLVCIVH